MEWKFQAGDPALAATVRKEMIAHLKREAPRNVDLADAEVVIGELLSNAAMHSRGCVTATIRAAHGEPFVTVCDNGPVFKFKRARALRDRNTALDEHGRGLHLISVLSRDAKVHLLAGRKAVTVQLAIH